MGILESPLRRIEAVRFSQLKAGQPAKDIVAICRPRADYGCVYVLTKHGSVFTTEGIGRNMALTGHIDEYIAALVDLGLVSKEERRAHKKWYEAHKLWKEIREKINRVIENLAKFGVTLSPKQEKILKRTLAMAEEEVEDALDACIALNKKYDPATPKG